MSVLSRRIFAAGLALCLCAPGWAAPAPEPSSPPFTIEEAVRLAVTRNPSLQAAARDAESAALGLRAARALSAPEILFTPAITPDGSDEELLIRQPLEINGSRAARAGIAGARLRGARASAEVTLRDVVFTTEAAYYELALARALEVVAREVLTGTRELDRLTARQVELGSRAGIERTQTAIEAARAQQQLSQATARVDSARAALNIAMGRSPDDPIGPLSPLDAPPAEAGEITPGKRPEVAAAEAERDALLQEARLARAEGRPDIAPQFRAGSVLRGVRETGLGIGITIPLLDYGARRNRIRQSEEAARAQEYRITAQIAEARLEVAAAAARLRAAESIVAQYSGPVLEQSRRLLDASRVGFEAGQTNIQSLLDARRTYVAVQAEYAQALAERAIAHAEMRRATAAVPTERLPSLPMNAREN